MRNGAPFACLLLLACSGQAGDNRVDGNQGDNSQAEGAAEHNPALARDRPEAKSLRTLRLTSPSFPDGGEVPLIHTAYGKGLSPALNWSKLPSRTKSLVLLLEDPDVASKGPFVHWAAWNIEPSLSGLPEGLPDNPELSEFASLRQGRNSRGSTGYFGPRPPDGETHAYHFQLFALDSVLTLAGGSGREDLLAAIDNHVIAKGELVGRFGRPPQR